MFLAVFSKCSRKKSTNKIVVLVSPAFFSVTIWRDMKAKTEKEIERKEVCIGCQNVLSFLEKKSFYREKRILYVLAKAKRKKT